MRTVSWQLTRSYLQMTRLQSSWKYFWKFAPKYLSSLTPVFSWLINCIIHVCMTLLSLGYKYNLVNKNEYRVQHLKRTLKNLTKKLCFFLIIWFQTAHPIHTTHYAIRYKNKACHHTRTQKICIDLIKYLAGLLKFATNT